MIRSIKAWVAWDELVISADGEHRTGMDHMVSSPATHPVTQVGYTAVTVVVDKKRILPYSLFV